MNSDTRHCDTCPWPLDCCPDEAASPRDIDCPRDTAVWSRRLAALDLEVANTALLEASAAADEELILV